MKSVMKPLSTLIALLASLTLLLLTACGGGDSPEKETAERSPRQIRSELMQVQSELGEFANEHDLFEKEVVMEAEQAYMEAVQAFNRARREHPELAPHFEESDRIQKESIQKKIAGDEAGFDELMGKYRESRTTIEKKSSELPEIQDMAEKLKEAEQASVNALANAAASVNEQGEKLAKQMKGLLAELN